MVVYFIANFDIINQDLYDQYGVKTRDTLAPYMKSGKGKLLLMTQDEGKGTVEGNPANKIVMIEFDSRETAEEWYNSENYQKLIPMRQEASENSWVTITDQFQR